MQSLQEGKPVLSSESQDLRKGFDDLRKAYSGSEDVSSSARNMGGISLHGDTVRSRTLYPAILKGITSHSDSVVHLYGLVFKS